MYNKALADVRSTGVGIKCLHCRTMFSNSIRCVPFSRFIILFTATVLRQAARVARRAKAATRDELLSDVIKYVMTLRHIKLEDLRKERKIRLAVCLKRFKDK